jgi:hypothetical protein
MRFLRYGLVGLVLLCTGCIPVSQDPANVSLKANDPDTGVILMRLGPPTGTIFWMSRYEEKTHHLVDMNRVFKTGKQAFVAKAVPVGAYVPMAIFEQVHWNGCMNGGTLAFDVGPGEIVYLGHVDLSPSLFALGERVKREGKTVARGSDTYDFFDDIPPPSMTFPEGEEKALAEANAFVAANMPDVHGTVRLAQFRPAKFDTGTFVTDRVCGGSFLPVK